MPATPAAVAISAEEEEYLLALARSFFAEPAGARRHRVEHTPACARSTTTTAAPTLPSVTRDYRFELSDGDGAPPLLTVLGGKLTTYRRLAEAALAKLAPLLSRHGAGRGPHRVRCPAAIWAKAGWRASSSACARAPSRFRSGFPRPPGAALRHAWSKMCWARRDSLADLGAELGGGLTEREVVYLRDHEWAREPDDVLWRRTKCGLHIPGRGAGSPPPTASLACSERSGALTGIWRAELLRIIAYGAGAYRRCRPRAVHVDDLALLQLQRPDLGRNGRRCRVFRGPRRRPPAPCRADARAG